jgi:hypothetical protein
MLLASIRQAQVVDLLTWRLVFSKTSDAAVSNAAEMNG